MGPPSFSSNSKGLTNDEAPDNRGLSPLFARSASFLRITLTFRHPSCGIKAFVGPLFKASLRDSCRKESIKPPGARAWPDTTGKKHEATCAFYPVERTTLKHALISPLRFLKIQSFKIVFSYFVLCLLY